MNPKIILASGPVIVENNNVLLDEHGDTNYWKFCGGTVNDFTTDLIENAKRKAREEMGIEIEIVDEVPYIFYTTKEQEHGKVDVIVAHFLAKRVGKITPGEDIREWTWLPLKGIENENLAPSIIPALKYFGFV